MRTAADYFLLASFHLAVMLFVVFIFSSAAAVAALLQSPLVTSNARVAEAACWAVRNLAGGNAENTAKLGAAGVCEGGYPA